MKTNLRGVSVAHNPSEKRAPSAVVWSSGSHGVIVRSLDEGRSWRRLRVSGGDALDFRGIVAFSASLAYVISSGEGVKSRIYKTSEIGRASCRERVKRLVGVVALRKKTIRIGGRRETWL